ncbi:MAG: hypothetical protein KF812_00155 [Fimbriimonadaceae bacterium]|nr:hypothetical protein [Fimbriimonadaceae bacterium]
MTALCAMLAILASQDVLLQDFESVTYGSWVSTGTAFGSEPAQGTLPNQMEVSGYRGSRLANSFVGGDASTGTLSSPAFTITHSHITFLIGGGSFPETSVNLMVGGRAVRSSSGSNSHPSGSEALEPDGWDVRAWLGQTA